MHRQISMETVDRAEQLFCSDGQSFSRVAALTGVSLRTLKRWSGKYGWMEKRLEAGRALAGVRTKMVLLREKLIENCMETLNAQDAFAVVAMERLAGKAALDDAGAAPDPPRDARPGLDGEKDSIAALERACRIRMKQLLADPAQISFPAIRGLEAALDLVGDLKYKLSRREDNDPSRSLLARAEAEIRRKILG